MNLMCKLDRWDMEWNQEMSEEMARISGIETIIHFLEQSQHDNYKAQAAQIVGMIAEEASINNLLNENDTIEILIEAVLHKSMLVKRNATEALAFLIKDEYTRNNHIVGDRIMHVMLGELQKSNDQVLTENLLLIIMNLSLSKHFKPLLYESGFIDTSIYNIVNGNTIEE
mmetsp:Transcript_35876/g.34929  ORF Transcript_35876/g.34929 Transcript_35876/m.34929 type:complete len:170 (-) Transcript_35876:199-708(-)